MPTKSIVLSLDTAAYAAGDVLAATQEVTGVGKSGKRLVIEGIVLHDKSDVGAQMDIVILNANKGIGAENAAAGILAADVPNVVAVVSVATADWIDLGAGRVASKLGLNIEVKPAASGTSFWVAVITRALGTWSATGIEIRFQYAHK